MDGSGSVDEDALGLSVDLRGLVGDVETVDADLVFDPSALSTLSSGSLNTTVVNGVYSFVPSANFNGQVSFTYKVTDRGDPDNCGTAGSGCAGVKSSATKTFTITVRPDNDAPTVTADGDEAVDEGSLVTVGATFTDVEADGHTALINWGDGSETDGTVVGGTVSADHTYVDNRLDDAPYLVTVTVTDDAAVDGGSAKSDFATLDVTVKNVTPEVAVTLDNIDAVTGKATLNATFTDPGADTWTGGFSITYPGGAPTVGLVTWSGHTLSAPVTLSPGCFAYTFEATVTDDDETTGTNTVEQATATDVYRVTFKAPLVDGQKNVVKSGNVVPVKIGLASSCAPGKAIAPQTLHVQLVRGIPADETADGTANLLTASVSNADSGTLMRLSGDGYMYNLSTPKLIIGQPYTIRIRVGSVSDVNIGSLNSTAGSIIATALLYTKK